MANRENMLVEKEADPKPFKVDRVDQAGGFVSREAEYATAAEALAHKRRLALQNSRGSAAVMAAGV